MNALVRTAGLLLVGSAALVVLWPVARGEEDENRLSVDVDAIGPVPGARVSASFASTAGRVPVVLVADAASSVRPPPIWGDCSAPDPATISGGGLPSIVASARDPSAPYSAVPEWRLFSRRLASRADVRVSGSPSRRRWHFRWRGSPEIGAIRCVTDDGTAGHPRLTVVDPQTWERYGSREDGTAFAVVPAERPAGADFLVLPESYAPLRVSVETIRKSPVVGGVHVLRLDVHRVPPLVGAVEGLSAEDASTAGLDGWAWDAATGVLIGRCDRVGGLGFRFDGLTGIRCVIVIQVVRGGRVFRGSWEGVGVAEGVRVPVAQVSHRYDASSDCGVRIESGSDDPWSVCPLNGDRAGAIRVSRAADAARVVPGRYLAFRGSGGADDPHVECEVRDGLEVVLKVP